MHQQFLVYHLLRSHGWSPRTAWSARCSLYRFMGDDDRVDLSSIRIHLLDETIPQPVMLAEMGNGDFVALPVTLCERS